MAADDDSLDALPSDTTMGSSTQAQSQAALASSSYAADCPCPAPFEVWTLVECSPLIGGPLTPWALPPVAEILFEVHRQFTQEPANPWCIDCRCKWPTLPRRFLLRLRKDSYAVQCFSDMRMPEEPAGEASTSARPLARAQHEGPLAGSHL
eukprot:5622395-Pleurochrysis_carterae.AAC.2